MWPKFTANEAIGNMKTTWARQKQKYLTLGEQCGQGASKPLG